MKYRKVSVYIWNDEKFSTLTDDAKLLFLFVLTHPHMTSVGSMRSSVYGLSAELNWTINKTQKGFRELFQKGLVNHNERACCILLPNFIKHNPPENPNVVKSWSNALELVPECGLKKDLISLLNQHVNTMTEPYQEAFKTVLKGYAKPFGKGMAKQEQEQEQEQEQDIYTPKPPAKKKKFIPPTRDETVKFFTENGYTKESAQKAWAYYQDGYWKDSRGNQVKNWKQKMRGVWFKDENKASGGLALVNNIQKKTDEQIQAELKEALS